MLRTREDRSLKKAMRSVSSKILVEQQEMIVALRLPLNVVIIILGCIFSMLFCDFRACGPIIMYTPPMEALIEFIHVDAETNVYLLPVS